MTLSYSFCGGSGITETRAGPGEQDRSRVGVRAGTKADADTAVGLLVERLHGRGMSKTAWAFKQQRYLQETDPSSIAIRKVFDRMFYSFT